METYALLCETQIVGICYMTRGARTRALGQPGGEHGVGGRREVQERGDRCTPMVDSC